MKTYNQFISLVRNWSNRDEEVLSNSIIADCLTYAADKAYRTLRIPPLEQTVIYSSSELVDATIDANNGTTSITELSIPSNLIEFIQIRATTSTGVTTRVFNEKADVRTFYDQYAEKYSGIGYWTRKGNSILLSPGFQNANFASSEDQVELYYYRRLPALNARFDVTAENANLSETLVSEVTEDNPPPTDYKTNTAVDTAQLKKAVYTNDSDDSVVSVVFYETSTADGDIPAAPTGQTRTITTSSYYGSEVPNWLRDENERILLNGALAEVFIYLNEPDTASMYANLFSQEIQELNNEEAQRRASGGNIQFNFNGNGLI
jgi:hypothetical protein